MPVTLNPFVDKLYHLIIIIMENYSAVSLKCSDRETAKIQFMLLFVYSVEQLFKVQLFTALTFGKV